MKFQTCAYPCAALASTCQIRSTELHLHTSVRAQTSPLLLPQVFPHPLAHIVACEQPPHVHPARPCPYSNSFPVFTPPAPSCTQLNPRLHQRTMAGQVQLRDHSFKFKKKYSDFHVSDCPFPPEKVVPVEITDYLCLFQWS